MITLILQSLYFMLPAYFANMAPVLVQKYWKPLAIPMDNNVQFMGAPLLGAHKTWRGFLSAIIAGELIFLLQMFIAIPSLIDYATVPLYLGFLMGFGAISGDILKSFLKRRLNIAPGKAFPIFDQLDFVIGSLIASSIVVDLPLIAILIIVIVSPILTIVVNRIAYSFRIRNEAW